MAVEKIKKIKFLLLIATLIVAFSAISSSWAAPLLTLKDSIFLALRYNTTVKNAELARITDKFNLKVAQYAYELQFQLTGSYNYTNTTSNGIRSESDTTILTPQASLLLPYGTQITTGMVNQLNHTGGSASYYNPSLSFSLTQPLLRGFGPDIVLVPLYNARDTELVNQLNLKNTLITTLTTIISQYSSLIQAKNSLRVQEIQLEAAKITLKNSEAFVRAGRYAVSDLTQFRFNIASQELSLEQQQISFQQALLTFLNTIGLDPKTQIELPTTIDFPSKPLPSLPQAKEIAYKFNISYQTALINMRSLERAYMVAKDNQRWQLNATLAHTRGPGSGGAPNDNIESLLNGRNKTTTLGLALNVPINNITLQQQEVSAKVALDQARNQIAFLKLQLENQVINAYETLILQGKVVVQADQNRKLARQTLDIARAKMRYGRVTAFEVSTLQTNLITADISYIAALSQYAVALSNLDQVLGVTLDRWNIEVKY